MKQPCLGGVAPAAVDSSFMAGSVLCDTAQQCQVNDHHVLGAVGPLPACVRDASARSEDRDAVQASSESAGLWMLTSTDNKYWPARNAHSEPQYLWSAAICQLCVHVMTHFSALLAAFFVRSNKCVGLAKWCTGKMYVCLMPLGKVASESDSTVKTAEVR